MSDNELFKIPEEALKKIKTQEEFEDYIQRLYKQGVEALLKAEIKEHLGYPKYDPTGKNSGNSRNGFSRKTLKTNLGEVPWMYPATATPPLIRWLCLSRNACRLRLNMPL